MEKNLLIFISIVLLNSASSYADKESELPALPTSFEVQVEEKSGADSSKSLWQKFKEYFGFGEEKKIEKNQPDTPLAVRKKKIPNMLNQNLSMMSKSLVTKKITTLFLTVYHQSEARTKGR